MSSQRALHHIQSLPTSVPFVSADELERQRGRPFLLRLGANESPFGISPGARQAMIDAAADVAHYCDSGGYRLRSAIAESHDVDMHNVVLGSGIDDLLLLVARAFLDAQTRVVTSRGGYPTFGYFAASCGATTVDVAFDDDRNDLQALLDAAIDFDARILYLVNPINPTGSWHSASEITSLLRDLPRDCLLLLDEAYVEFAPQDAIAAIEVEHPQVIRLRTFSKAHGLAGARIGYAIAAREMIETFDKIRVQYGVNRIAQSAALASLRDKSFVANVVEEVERGRPEYQLAAAEVGLRALPSATNFVAFDLGSGARARAVVKLLEESDVFVRSPAVSPLDRLVRVTVGKPEQRAKFCDIFQQIVTSGHLPPLDETQIHSPESVTAH